MVNTAELRHELGTASPGNAAAARHVRSRADNILRPAGALSRLDDIAVWIAQWHGSTQPRIESPVAVIFAGDHGVASDGVSAYPSNVTQSMFDAFNASKATVSALARVAGAKVIAVDVGIGRPTNNLRHEAAMSSERFDESFEVGRETVRELSTDLLIVGEMGIGNTTAAAAICTAILEHPVAQLVGRGTGLDDEALRNKRAVVSQAASRIALVTDPIEILRHVGGTELAAIAGALVEARMRAIPVLLDGFITTAPLLVLREIGEGFVSNCRAGHCSAEPGHRLSLDHLGLEPLLELDLRLGEASGAVAALPLVKMACAAVTEVPTFEEWFDPDR